MAPQSMPREAYVWEKDVMSWDDDNDDADEREYTQKTI